MKETRLLTAAIAIAAMLTGCGGGTADPRGEKSFTVVAATTMTTGALTKSQFVSRVDRICRRNWPVIIESFASYSSEYPHMRPRPLFAKTVRAMFLSMLDFRVFDAIRKLKAPIGDKLAVEHVLGEMQLAVERDQRELHTYTPDQLTRQFAAYNQAAQQYGLGGECLVYGSHLKSPRLP